jgi:hypothetical protein
MESIMKDLVRLAIIAAFLSATSLPALAWQPQRGSASAQRTMTTPGGKSYESSGSATYGNGSASGQRTVTGPNGSPTNPTQRAAMVTAAARPIEP